MMKFLKTELSKIHAVVAFMALITLTIGSGMALGLIPFIPYGELHGLAGASIIPLLLLLPLLSKNRKNLYKALQSRILITKRDLVQKKPLLIAAKIVTFLMAIAFLFQLLTGFLMESGLTYQLFPNFGMLSFHIGFLYVLGTLILAHLTLMWLVTHPKAHAKK